MSYLPNVFPMKCVAIKLNSTEKKHLVNICSRNSVLQLDSILWGFCGEVRIFGFGIVSVSGSQERDHRFPTCANLCLATNCDNQFIKHLQFVIICYFILYRKI